MPGIYIHIPFCKSKCSYCDFASYPGEIEKAELYFGTLYKEIKGRSQDLSNYTFDTVYFGGGTPSYVEPKYIYGAMKQLSLSYSIKKDAEITLEVNPGTLTLEKLEIYKKAGINRFSIGLQSANDNTLYDIGRIHTKEDYIFATNLVKDFNFSTDIMIGLPNETKEDVKNSLDLAINQGSKHISVYSLKAEEGTPMFSRYLNGELPSDDEVAEIYDFVVEYLKKHGIFRYEVSNFAKPGFESKHNLNYWKRGEYIGFGVAASSCIRNRRFTNTDYIDDYTKCILSGRFPEVFTEDVELKDQKGEYIMLALRTTKGFKLEDYKAYFNSNFLLDYKQAIEKNKKYLEITDKEVRIKDEYLYVQNSILVYFI